MPSHAVDHRATNSLPQTRSLALGHLAPLCYWLASSSSAPTGQVFDCHCGLSLASLTSRLAVTSIPCSPLNIDYVLPRVRTHTRTHKEIDKETAWKRGTVFNFLVNKTVTGCRLGLLYASLPSIKGIGARCGIGKWAFC